MAEIFKIIYMLLKAVLFKKSEYTISFYKEEDGRWFADIPGWPKKYHDKTEMVFGADLFLEHVSKGNNKVTLQVWPTNKRTCPVIGAYAILVKDASKLLNGAIYTPYVGGEFSELIWIRPVTLFFLGYYPNRIYIKVETVGILRGNGGLESPNWSTNSPKV